MNKSILVAFFLIFCGSLGFAQKNINNYKYVIVPKQYEFQKSEDSYQINSLTKFLFERSGFTTYFSTDKLSEELANNGCMALKAIIRNSSGILNTKLNIDLVDCYNTIVFSTSEAKSKEKDYKKAYHTAIRTAFEDIDALGYKYNPVNSLEAKIAENIEKKEEVKSEVDISETVQEVNMVKIERTKTPIKKEVEVSKNSIEAIENKLLTVSSIEGTYIFDAWGKSSIAKKDNEFIVIGGDENVELATIYSTSKPTIYIIKWRAFKQPQLVEITTNGDLYIDTATGKKVYKKVM